MWNMESKSTKKYRFGHTVFRVVSPVPLDEDPQLAPFAVGNEVEHHHTFRVVPAEAHVSFSEGESCHTSVRDGDETLVYVKDTERLKGYALSLLLSHHKAYDILIERRALVLHASYVVRDGKALLFSAPSGTGKSTQAHFWEKERGCSIINEDRVILFEENGVWYAAGCWAMGGARITSNVTVPVDALVLLSQGSENRVSPIRPSEALRRLIPQCAYSTQNGAMRQGVISVLCDLIPAVRMVSYACINHPSSVAYLENELWKK
jgi:hypothetical protein